MRYFVLQNDLKGSITLSPRTFLMRVYNVNYSIKYKCCHAKEREKSYSNQALSISHTRLE